MDEKKPAEAFKKIEDAAEAFKNVTAIESGSYEKEEKPSEFSAKDITSASPPLEKSKLLSHRIPYVMASLPSKTRPERSPLQFLQLMQNYPRSSTEKKIFTAEEVANHCSGDDVWVILNGEVYNISPYLDFHPGGRNILFSMAGKDCTEHFNAIHPWVNANRLIASLSNATLRATYLSQTCTLTVLVCMELINFLLSL